MILDDRAVQWLALGGAAVALLSLLVTLLIVVRLRRLRAAYDTLARGSEGGSFVEAVGRQHREAEGLRTDVGMLRDEMAAARADLSDALRHVAVVRYDAFGDMGGRLSFSAALLDDAGDGLVLTSINGRSETRTYAKGVTAGGSDHALSPEESEAINYASRPGTRPVQAPPEPVGRRGRFSRR